MWRKHAHERWPNSRWKYCANISGTFAADGEWLSVNDEAVCRTKPWSAQSDTINKHVWCVVM